MSEDAAESLTPIAPTRVAQEIRKIGDLRKSGELDDNHFEYRFSRTISELRDRRISGTREEIMAALEPLRAEGLLAAKDWDRMLKQLGLA